MSDTSRSRVPASMSRTSRAMVALAATAIVVNGCSPRRPVENGAAPAGRARGASSALDVSRLYREAGLIVETTPVPFVGTTDAFATQSPDTTLVLVTLSLPNRALTFVHEGDHYRGAYDVMIDARRNGSSATRTQGRQTVRVASYRETSRGDESLIFQQYLRLPPDSYVFNLTVRDAESGRTTTRDAPVTVPRIGRAGASSAVAVYEAKPRPRRDTLPSLVPNPRGSAVFGQDTALFVYVERYGGTGPVQAEVRDARGNTVWRDSLMLPTHDSLTSGTFALPISEIGPGVATFVSWRGLDSDTARTRLIVSFAEGLAITSFEDMVSYLRYFATPEQLQSLRDAPPAERGKAWIAFLRSTDPDPATPEHEALRDYFVRIEQANQRFREEGGPGWLTDRGRVFITLGDPDQIYDQGQNDIAQRGRVQIWEYTQYRAQLVFVDQTGFGRYRMTMTSELEFQSLARRVKEK
ncbi:MAG TPA: GWxTD domain-containing protein [Gemmatimonadaceae bacterium]|nr:GWxTD domain-containing protein [Gemmatimonadaceae bacterium]